VWFILFKIVPHELIHLRKLVECKTITDSIYFQPAYSSKECMTRCVIHCFSHGRSLCILVIWSSNSILFSSNTEPIKSALSHTSLWPLRDHRDIYVPLTKSLFKSAGIRVTYIFSMLPSTLKYLYSVEPVRMHFPAKQLLWYCVQCCYTAVYKIYSV